MVDCQGAPIAWPPEPVPWQQCGTLPTLLATGSETIRRWTQTLHSPMCLRRLPIRHAEDLVDVALTCCSTLAEKTPTTRRSDQNSCDSLTWWCCWWASLDRSIMRRIKVRPGWTTVAAWLRLPVRDCNSCFVAIRLLRHERTRPRRRVYLSSPRLSCMVTECREMLGVWWVLLSYVWQQEPLADGTPAKLCAGD